MMAGAQWEKREKLVPVQVRLHAEGSGASALSADVSAPWLTDKAWMGAVFPRIIAIAIHTRRRACRAI